MHALPSSEHAALQACVSELEEDLANARETFSETDPWHKLIENGGDRRDEMVLRVLRYQCLDVAKAAQQVRSILQWRKKADVGTIGPEHLHGRGAGLPAVLLPGLGEGKRMLMYAAAEHYVKKLVVAERQEKAIIRLFEHVLYAPDGANASSAVVIVDFMDMSFSDVDLAAMKRGISIFLRYYPETFSTILLFNYPRFVYGCKYL